MASQKDVKNRIASIKNINKITRAMEMVAARLRRAEQRIEQRPPYAKGMRKLTRRAAEQAVGCPGAPVMVVEREDVKRVGVVLITGHRGLAGAFNTNVIRDGPRLRDELSGQGVETAFSAVGRKGVPR